MSALCEAIILAGGRGTRLKSVVSDRPKPMALVAGRPFIEWLILALRNQGVRHIVVASGHQGDVLHRHFRGNPVAGVDICFAQETSALGTGGAMRNALDLVDTEQVVVLNGDSFCPFTLSQLGEAQTQNNSAACLWLVEVMDSSRFGSVCLATDGRVAAFREKTSASGPGLINAGVYLFRRNIIAEIPRGRSVSLEHETLPGLLALGELRGIVGSGPFLDIGTPESYGAAADFFGDMLTNLSKAS